MAATLTAHRRFCCGVIALFKAAVWTFHGDFFRRRRLCHGVALF
jgi:hypothetical protein